MPRLAAFAAAALLAPLAGAWARTASAAETDAASPPIRFLTWPGKSAAPAAGQSRVPTAAPAVALPRQFFASGGDDLAAPPPPLPPRTEPGTQAATSSANTASNRARQNDILTADSASDGPVAGAESPN